MEKRQIENSAKGGGITLHIVRPAPIYKVLSRLKM